MSPRPPLLLRLAAAVAVAVAAVPLVYLVVRATDRGSSTFVDLLVRDRTAELVVRSVELAVAVTAACLVIGIGSAWLVTRTDVAGRRFLRVALGLPLALPSYVAAFSWITLWPDSAGFRGSFVVLVTLSYPYVYLPVLGALRRCDPALEDAARTLGLGRWAVFRRVVLPQLRPAATGGGLLVGLYVLSDYGAVATMRYEVLTHAIYRSYQASFDRTPAAVLACVLAALTLAVLVVEGRLRRRRGPVAAGAAPIRPQPVHALGRWRWPALLLPVGVLTLALGVPAWGLRRWSVRGSSQADPAELWAAAQNSLLVGVVAAAAVMVLAVPVAFLTVRHPGRWAGAAERAAYLGHALPGVVVGLGLVFFGVRFARPWYQELPLLVFGYVVLFLSLGLGAVQASVAQVPPVLEAVARTLGRTAFGAWRSVTLRLILPGVAAGAALVALAAMKELPATLFLRPTGWDSLATGLWGHLQAQSYAAAAPYGVAIVALAAVPTALLLAVGDRRRTEGAAGR
ncbi:MAG: iron ABC transporter permease [Actinobacteria bacterium]|nr:iron ABC transporter permease [Actinomycetota bacterium]